MTKLLVGERIGRGALLRVGTAAVIFDQTRQKILLTQRSDNGRWCLPGGMMEPGESAEEGCMREVWEETGLQVAVRRLIGIYTSPHRIMVYNDGNRVQYASFCFEAEVVGGELRLSEETIAYGYYAHAELHTIDLMENHIERVEDAFANAMTTFIR
jgi:ADP-ribose pyrophosphatase YjhB (NUDIX family)